MLLTVNLTPFDVDSELAQEPSHHQYDHTEDEQEEIEKTEINGVEDSDSGSSFEELNHS